MAFDNSGGGGKVYLADSGNNRIEVFSSSGAYLNQWNGASSGTAFNVPYGVAADSSNNIYVADTYNQRIVKFAP